MSPTNEFIFLLTIFLVPLQLKGPRAILIPSFLTDCGCAQRRLGQQQHILHPLLHFILSVFLSYWCFMISKPTLTCEKPGTYGPIGACCSTSNTNTNANILTMSSEPARIFPIHPLKYTANASFAVVCIIRSSVILPG